LDATVESFVEAMEGYGLSENDFTDELLEKLENLPKDIDTSSKVDKIAATKGNEGNLVVLGTNDNGRGIADTGIKIKDLLHIVPPSESTLEEGGTASFTLESTDGYGLAIMHLALTVGENFPVHVTIEVDGTGAFNEDQGKYLEGFDYGVEVEVTSSIPLVTLTIDQAEETVKITNAKIMYL
jgi:hypothetical protein